MDPRICAVITDANQQVSLPQLRVDFVELRLDMIGNGWIDVLSSCSLPTIVTNRHERQGGQFTGSETERRKIIYNAIDAGADFADIDIHTADLSGTVETIKKKGGNCLLSYHNFRSTPDFKELYTILQKQLEYDADICKIITTAQTMNDNLVTLGFLKKYHTDHDIVSFCMGDLGMLSRTLSPFCGGLFTYASLTKSRQSAPGQVTVETLTNIYGMLEALS